MLRRHGISPILNFAAEDDVSHSASEAQDAVSCGERASDANLQPFLRSINIVGQREGKGFVQAKVSHPSLCKQ